MDPAAIQLQHSIQHSVLENSCGRHVELVRVETLLSQIRKLRPTKEKGYAEVRGKIGMRTRRVWRCSDFCDASKVSQWKSLFLDNNGNLCLEC